ncbi:hypothetical protein NBRC116188_24590 [Oceaniserpentilla sp. 4NH20-0058]|uniref:hypothetical protein n=1 Tax=Oceaniserpentilla sp. 4NH20-0058 TaxID=3127660 RepID=UPI00310BE7AC
MAITLFILLFSIGLLALLTVLLHTKKITSVVFAALVALLTIFDYALLSLDKIYYLHLDQDKQLQSQMKKQKDVIGQLTQVQLDMTLQLLSQSSSQDNETSITKKLQWRDLLLAQLRLAEFQQVKIDKVKQQIDLSVHVYLMEQLNKQLIQSLGHRIYSDFVRSRPRDEWTDELFIKDLNEYLNKETLMKPEIEFAIKRIVQFDQTGELLNR